MTTRTLLGLTLTIALAGCTGGGGRAAATTAAAATVAPATSSSVPTTPPLTTTPVLGPSGPVATITSATWRDVDKDGRASAGDQVDLVFSHALAFGSSPLSAAGELALPVAGDSLGAGATLAPDTDARRAIVTLGADPVLRIGGTFSARFAGCPSGIDVKPTGNVLTAGTSTPPGSNPVDLAGTPAAADFHDAGTMVVARGAHEAVLLDDGRVLVVGGTQNTSTGAPVEDAEVFDPRSNRWTLVSVLAGKAAGRCYDKNGAVVRRYRHTATKLADGTVLVAGGVSPTGTVAEAHVFDPVTNAFTRVGDMVHPRYLHAATLLPDGRVLISGGTSLAHWPTPGTYAPFDVYDPKTKTFSDESALLAAPSTETQRRRIHAAFPTSDGALLAGGEVCVTPPGQIYPLFAQLHRSEEVLSLSKKALVATGNLVEPRRFPGAAVLPTGERLVVGGHDDGSVSTFLLASFETWTEASGKWTRLPVFLKVARTRPSVVVSGEDAFVIGGVLHNQPGAHEVTSVETLDARTRTLGPSYALKLGRVGATATRLADGRILVAGGFTGSRLIEGTDGVPTGRCEVFVRP